MISPRLIQNQVDRWKAKGSAKVAAEVGKVVNATVIARYAVDTRPAWAVRDGELHPIGSPLGTCVCVTCAKSMRWSSPGCHAGHWAAAAGTRRPHRYDVRNIHPQCYQCNAIRSSNAAAYDLYLLHVYGQQVMDEIRHDRKTKPALINEELALMILTHREELRELRKELT